MDAIEYFKGMRKRLCEDHLKLLPKKSVGYQTTLREMSFYDAAIKALEQEPCEDAISRSEAIRVASGYCHWSNIPKELEKLPSVSVKEKAGCWVEIDDEPHEVWECDHCGFVIDGSGCIDPYEYKDIYKYCPNCGAKMVEPQESEEQDADSN